MGRKRKSERELVVRTVELLIGARVVKTHKERISIKHAIADCGFYDKDPEGILGRLRSGGPISTTRRLFKARPIAVRVTWRHTMKFPAGGEVYHVRIAPELMRGGQVPL
jgi:hypothetical protein